ncbi:cadg multi-domain protein [Stylonychia lemnae]|uniref:Cadg multi-domain protein n=1 Tax=Stylonychia lemnae TaxID=5949 RepID=A0A078ARZ3_STYLE|nr:cadg multi-domain protein [Stylonychia lemnae]|eukprot:CDW83967.1 cadg multi-domain protein [Stylonychia lemnae]
MIKRMVEIIVCLLIYQSNLVQAKISKVKIIYSNSEFNRKKLKSDLKLGWIFEQNKYLGVREHKFDTQCTDDVIQTGFNIDGNDNMISSGYVTSSASTSCPLFTNSQIGKYPFLTKLDQYGQIQWITTLTSSSSKELQSPILGDTSAYAYLVAANILRIVRLTADTGTQDMEKNFDFFSSSSATLKNAQLLQLSAETDIYSSITVQTSFFAASSTFEGILMKLDKDLAIQWFKRSRGFSTNPLFSIDDAYLTSSNIWQLSYFYTSASQYSNSVQKIQKSDGTIKQELRWYNSAPTANQGSIVINSDETKWYTVIQGSTNLITHQVGLISSNTLQSNFQTTFTLKDINHHIDPNDKILFVKINPQTGAFLSIQTIQKGTTSSLPQLTKTASSDINSIYISYHNSAFISGYKSRIIFYKVDYDLEISGYNCINVTSATITTSTALTSANSVSSLIPLYATVSEASVSLSTVTAQSLNSPAALANFYTFYDTSIQPDCMIPNAVIPSEIIYDLNTDAGIAREVGPLTVTSCLGKQFTITGVQNQDGTTITGTQITYTQSTKVIKINLAITDYVNYVGTLHFRVVATYKDVTVYPQLRITVLPLITYVRDPTNPNHDTSTCAEKIYPFFYGHTFNSHLLDFKIDNYGNFLIAGSGVSPPFGSSGTIENGFLSLMDQRGNPYWIYSLDTQVDATSAQYCQQISQQSTFVFGLCQSKVNMYINVGLIGLLIKLNHKNGQLLYSKMLPNDQYQPQNQLPLYLQSINTDRLLIIQRYQSSAGAYKSFSAFLLNETSQLPIWYNYYPTDTTFYEMSFLVDQTNGFFYQFKHVTEYKMWKQEFTSYYLSFGIQMWQDTPFYAFQGQYASANKDSFIIFKDTKTHNYVDLPILAATETQFYPSFSTTVVNPVITIISGVEIPAPLQTANIDFLHEIGGIKMFTTIKLTLPSNNCQGKQIKLTVLNPFTDTSTFEQTFISFDNNDTVAIDTNLVVRPLQFSLKVRYADEAMSTSEAYFDYSILIRIVAPQNLTIEVHNQDECFQNQFSMSFGSNCGNCFFYSNGFYLSREDENMILVGQAAPTNAFFINEDLDDAFIVRISPTGWVYWLNQVSANQNVNDAITSVTMSKGFIYCFFHNYGSTEPNRIHALIKLSYEEGKVQWTKRIIPSNPIDTNSFIVSFMRYMVTNPYNSSQIMSSVLFQWNADSMYSGNILFVNDGVDFKSDYNIIIKPLAKLAGSRNSAGYIEFHPDSNFVYMAHASYTTSGSYQDMMLMKLDAITKQIIWSNTYNRFRTLPEWEQLQPAISFCNKTQFLYMMTFPFHLQIVKLDKNGARQTRGNIHQRGSDYYIVGINMWSYGTTTPTSEAVFWKHHYELSKRLNYDCHSFPVVNYFSIVNNYTPVNTAIPSLAIVVNPQQLLLLDADFIKSYQLQTYGPGLLYPNSDKLHASTYYDTNIQCENTGLSPPSQEALTSFEVNMGELKTFDISDLGIKQCQKMKVTYTLYDEANMLTRTINNNFISIVQNSQLIVDARNNPPYPSQRILYIKSCIQAFNTKCSINQATLVIWPLDMSDAPKTEGQTQCLGMQEFPKILGQRIYQVSPTHADMDKDNGNFVVCGRTTAPKYQNIQYPNTAQGGIIVFSSLYGQVYWAYNIQRILAGKVSYFLNCVIASDGYIYSLIFRETENQMAVSKLDITIDPPRVKWYTYILPTGSSTFSGVQQIVFPLDSRYFFSFGTMYITPQYTYYNYIQKYLAEEGKVVATINHPTSLTTSNLRIAVDSNFVYFSSAEYRTSTYYKYLRQYNLNLQIVNGFYFSMPTLNQVLWTSLMSKQPVFSNPEAFIEKLTIDLDSPDSGDQPRYSSPMINQIIQLPISTPKTYTFDYPVDCFNNELVFTWAVDFYASPPSFLTFTTSNKKATLNMNPTVSDIGTYSIQVVFINSKDTLLFTKDYFQVEIYPEKSYTDQVKCLDCPSRPLAMAFGIQADYVINYMDIDSKADYFIICGGTKTLQTKADTYTQSFILQYTKGYAMTFHLTMEAGSINNMAQQCNFGFQNNIYTMIKSFSQTLGDSDAIYITTHTSQGKFQDGRVFKTPDLNLRPIQMIAEPITGDTYLMGIQVKTFFAFDSFKYVFLMKYDRFYEIQFVRFYEYLPNEGYEINLDQVNLAIYMIHSYNYSPLAKNYFAILKVDQMDGDVIWAKTLRDTSGYIFQQGGVPSQQLGIRIIQNNLYSCLVYQTSGMTTSGSELYLSRHDPDTGLVLSQLQFGFDSGNDIYDLLKILHLQVGKILAQVAHYKQQIQLLILDLICQMVLMVIKVFTGKTQLHNLAGQGKYHISVYISQK